MIFSNKRGIFYIIYTWFVINILYICSMKIKNMVICI
nr:MAG TPA: hypothetical protein [Caudoviricetes sp.]